MVQSRPRAASRANELRLTAPCGALRLTVQAANAIRVPCVGDGGTQEPELIFTSPVPKVNGATGSDTQSSWLQTSQIKAVVDKRSGDIRFLDAKGKLLAFNVLNHPIWGTPGSTVNNTSIFGKETSQANSPRRLQLSAKIAF